MPDETEARVRCVLLGSAFGEAVEGAWNAAVYLYQSASTPNEANARASLVNAVALMDDYWAVIERECGVSPNGYLSGELPTTKEAREADPKHGTDLILNFRRELRERQGAARAGQGDL